MQTSFSEMEYTAKKEQTRRDIFLRELDCITPGAALERAVSSPNCKKRSMMLLEIESVWREQLRGDLEA